MENEKYDLIKAQEEAKKLNQKVASGEASNYDDAEKLVEQETKAREAIASQVGLKADSKLVEVLASFNQEEREEILSSLADEAQFFKTKSHNCSKTTLTHIFSALNNEAIASHIQTPEDFRYYAGKVMEMAKLHLLLDENGNPKEDEYPDGAIEGIELTVSAVAALSRGDFNRDLETMLQMMRDDHPGGRISVLQKLSRIGELIRTSEDLERIGQFVKRLSEHGFSARDQLTELFGTNVMYYSRNKEYQPDEKLTAWQEVITDSQKLDEVLSVMEAAFTHGVNLKEFMKKINSLPPKELGQFINLAQKFMVKDIPPQFVVENTLLLQDCNFSKDGLELFTSFESQTKWLEYCVQVWKQNPQNIDSIVKLFNEVLTSEIETGSKQEYKVNDIKGLSTEELTDIQENVDGQLGSATKTTNPNEKLRAFASKLLQSALGELYETKNFEAIANLAPVINEQYRKTVELFVLAASVFEKADFQNPIDFEGVSDADYKQAFEIAKSHSSEWQDEQTIAGPFQAGAETFGYKRMLEYITRKDLSLHDALHAFRDILELYRASGLDELEFYGQILQQVKMDDKEYPEGTAHHHLNAIAQTMNKNVTEVITKIQEYKEIERLQELAATFNSPQAVFASWINLKRYSELEQLLEQTEILDELKELKAEGNEKLYRYIETLAFHPDSKVNMGAVIQFWRDPEAFLAAEASHTPPNVHDRKKPSNYLYMPNLDLTAVELRDTLVEGKIDGLAVFTPLEIRYTIPVENVKSAPLPDLINKALGSIKNGVKGAARNPYKLFNELGKLLKPHGISVAEYIQGKSLPEGVNLSQEIETLLYNRDFGMERPLVKTREFVARINKKSDPEGVLAGDDTVNCMPFGDGKNTVYTFNPNTAQFVIRVVKDNGKERTIAQSVLTKDMDIQTLVPDVISKLQQEGEHLENVLPADILAKAPVYAACDNVEVTPNYSDERHQQIIEAIFRDFFKEYMNRYAKTEGLNDKKVPVGQGYTDALSQLPTEPNTFAPQAPVSYSDKTEDKVYVLDLESKAGLNLIWKKQVREIKVEKRTEPSLPPQIKGLEYLTFEDTLKVAYLEGKAYSDNQSLMQFLFNMENGLIAKDINNATKDRPNMSLKYIDETGRMHGYILSWEGRLSDENVKYKAREFFDQPCIYIIDIATDRENRMAGGRLIQGFAELYKQNYLDKGNPIPIFAQAREATSYQIVKRHLDKLSQDAGFNFELIELPTYKVGKDIMHPIIIRPVSKQK